jgi:hypothetical protein
MYKIIATPHSEYNSILGKNFNDKFVEIMKSFYKPFYEYNIPVDISKTVMEQVVSKSIEGGRWVGAGHNVVDVSTPTHDIDVKCVSSSNLRGLTTEASYLQNNKEENDHFNDLFNSCDYNALKEMFVDPLDEKVKNTKNLQLLSIIRDKTKQQIYYTLLSVVHSDLSEKEFIEQMITVGRGVQIPMIDKMLGKTEIYKPKRRLEIRLNCDGMKNKFIYSHSYKQSNSLFEI